MPKPPSHPPKNSSKGIARALADASLPLFIHEAKTQVEKLFSRQPVIRQMKSNLDVILSRQSIQPSYFDRAAFWYGRQSWLDQGIIAAILIGLSAVVGSIWSMPALFSAISISIYSLAAFILNDHQSVSTIRCQRLAADLKEMEHALKQEVSELSGIERSLRSVLHQLAQEQNRLAKENTRLETLTQTLKQQVQTQTKTVQELHAAHTDLTQTNQLLAKQLHRVKLDLKKATSDLLKQSNQFETLGIQVQTKTGHLERTHEQLEPLLKTYQTRIEQLSELTQLLNAKLENINAVSAHETHSENESLMQQAREQLNAFDALLASGQKKSGDSETYSSTVSI